MCKVAQLYITAFILLVLAFCPMVTSAEGPLGVNLLSNPGFEDDTPNGWEGWNGLMNPRSSLSPYSGTYCFGTYDNPTPGLPDVEETYQDIDLTTWGFDGFRLSTGGYRVDFGGYVKGNALTSATVSLINDGDELALEPVTADSWTLVSGSVRLSQSSADLRYLFQAPGTSAPFSHAYLDDAYVKLYAYDIWSWGISGTKVASVGDMSTSNTISVTQGMKITNDATLTTSGQVFSGSAFKTGTIDIDGGTWTASGKASIGCGRLGKGKVNVTNGGTWNTEASVLCGHNTNSKGTVNVDGGTWTALGETYIGDVEIGLVNVTNGGTWNVNNALGSLYIGDSTGSQGTVNVNGGTWTVTAQHTYIGRNGTGQVNVTNNGMWNMNDRVYLGRYSGAQGTVKVNDGTWTASEWTYIGYEGTGIVQVTNDGTWNMENRVYLGHSAGSQGTVNVNNGGTWTTLGGAYIGCMGTGKVNVTNNGTWDSKNVLYLGYYSDSQGTVNVDGGTWTASGLTYIGRLDPGDGTGAGSGRVDVNNGGQFTVNNNPLEINNISTLSIDGGTVMLNAGLNNNGTIDLISGTLSIAGPISGLMDTICGGTLELRGAETSHTDDDMVVKRDATLRLDGATFNVDTGGYLGFLGQLEFGDNGGTVNLHQAELYYSRQTLQLGGGLIAGSGKIFVDTAGLNLGSAGSTGSVVGTSQDEQLEIFGHVSGSGDLTNVTVYGDLAVGNSPGIIAADGLTLTGSGTLEMELGGRDAGSEFDQVLVNGPLVLDGTLEVVWYDGFEASYGDSFTLFDLSGGGSMTGTFDTIILPDLAPGLQWDISTLYSNGNLNTVPEPSTLVLLALGGLALMLRRKR